MLKMLPDNKIKSRGRLLLGFDEQVSNIKVRVSNMEAGCQQAHAFIFRVHDNGSASLPCFLQSNKSVTARVQCID